MASRETIVGYILEQGADAGPLTAKKMFGDYTVYCGTKIVALICDDQLFVKPTGAGRAFIGLCQDASPYPSAKKHLLISGEKWDDREWLSELLRITARELLATAVKKRRR